VRRATENMLIRDNNNGSYTASWTPATSGLYDILVKVDDFNAGIRLVPIVVVVAVVVVITSPQSNLRRAHRKCPIGYIGTP